MCILLRRVLEDIFSRPGRSKGFLYKQLRHSFINWLFHWLSHPLVKISLQHRYAQTVKDGASSLLVELHWEGSALKPAQQACLGSTGLIISSIGCQSVVSESHQSLLIPCKLYAWNFHSEKSYQQQNNAWKFHLISVDLTT